MDENPTNQENQELVKSATFLKQFRKLFQLRVLRFGSDEDGNLRVGILPESKEILIGGAAFLWITLERVSPPESQMRERQKRVSGNKVAESQNPLKLLGPWPRRHC